MEIFQYPSDGMDIVYTRRLIDPAEGAKLTGEPGGFTYGLLSALDTNPTGSLWEISNAVGGLDKNALFNIFRMQADVLKENYVGFSLTDRETGGSYNRVVGIDGQLKLAHKFFITFQAAGSKTKFEKRKTDIVFALNARFHYISKYAGDGIWWKSLHPDFEASSGFVNRVNDRGYGVFSYLSIYPQKQYMNQVTMSLSAGMRDDYFEDIVQDKWISADLQLRFNEFDQMF
jgi:hypothetical protein